MWPVNLQPQKVHDAQKSAADKADILHEANLSSEVVEVRCPFLALQHAVQTRAPAWAQHMTDQQRASFMYKKRQGV